MLKDEELADLEPAPITAESCRALRERTMDGLATCHRALLACGGNLHLAEEWSRLRGTGTEDRLVWRWVRARKQKLTAPLRSNARLNEARAKLLRVLRERSRDRTARAAIAEFISEALRGLERRYTPLDIDDLGGKLTEFLASLATNPHASVVGRRAGDLRAMGFKIPANHPDDAIAVSGCFVFGKPRTEDSRVRVDVEIENLRFDRVLLVLDLEINQTTSVQDPQ